MKKYCIGFAGVIGSSKTPIAHYLSLKFGLPIHNNDVIRTEVTEEFGALNEEEYVKRRDARLQEMIASGRSFILDASVDREWQTMKEAGAKAGYSIFLISLDLSRGMLEKLYHAKGYDRSLQLLDKFFGDHEVFLNEHGADIGLHLNDEQFSDRLRLSHEAVEKWLAT